MPQEVNINSTSLSIFALLLTFVITFTLKYSLNAISRAEYLLRQIARKYCEKKFDEEFKAKLIIRIINQVQATKFKHLQSTLNDKIITGNTRKTTLKYHDNLLDKIFTCNKNIISSFIIIFIAIITYNYGVEHKIIDGKQLTFFSPAFIIIFCYSSFFISNTLYFFAEKLFSEIQNLSNSKNILLTLENEKIRNIEEPEPYVRLFLFLIFFTIWHYFDSNMFLVIIIPMMFYIAVSLIRLIYTSKKLRHNSRSILYYIFNYISYLLSYWLIVLINTCLVNIYKNFSISGNYEYVFPLFALLCSCFFFLYRIYRSTPDVLDLVVKGAINES